MLLRRCRGCSVAGRASSLRQPFPIPETAPAAIAIVIYIHVAIIICDLFGIIQILLSLDEEKSRRGGGGQSKG